MTRRAKPDAKADPPKPQDGQAELLEALRAALSSTPPHVFDQLTSLSWAGLEAVEHADYLLFPEKIRRVRAGGVVEETAVMLRVPRGHELRKARALARKICADDGIDPDKDPDLLKDAEDLCLLSLAVRSDAPGYYEPLYSDPREFEKKYDRPVLIQLVQKVDALIALVDPRPDTLDPDQFLAMVAAIAKERSIRPLAAFGSAAQRNCVITMAELLAISLGWRSSSGSSERSTPEPSASATS